MPPHSITLTRSSRLWSRTTTSHVHPPALQRSCWPDVRAQRDTGCVGGVGGGLGVSPCPVSFGGVVVAAEALDVGAVEAWSASVEGDDVVAREWVSG